MVGDGLGHGLASHGRIGKERLPALLVRLTSAQGNGCADRVRGKNHTRRSTVTKPGQRPRRVSSCVRSRLSSFQDVTPERRHTAVGGGIGGAEREVDVAL